MKFLNLRNFWNGVRGRPVIVKLPGRPPVEFTNIWQVLNLLRGRPCNIMIMGDEPRPDLTALRRRVEAEPTDPMAHLRLAGRLADIASLDEAISECLKAITLLSSGQSEESDARRLSLRAFARYNAAIILEQMGRDADARQYWQESVEDWRLAVPQKDLHYIDYYTRAIDKLR